MSISCLSLARGGRVVLGGTDYTARNAQVAASPISGCVRIACSGLMITSLLQVVNRLAASIKPVNFLMKQLASSLHAVRNLQQVCMQA